MPTIVETTVYLIHELPDTDREAARSWYREHCLNHYWYEYVFDDFETICGILGIALGTSPVHLHNGKTRDAPHIYFRGFWSQGDGACFAGAYAYASNAKHAIRTHAPKDAELHRIADALQAEPPRLSRRPHLVRRGSCYGKTFDTLSGGGSRTGCPAGFRASGRAWLAMGGDVFDRGEVRLHDRDAAAVGPSG